MTSKGRPRIYCAGRAKGDTKCDCKGTFLDVYEAQIEWYLEHFEVPLDYEEKVLQFFSKLTEAYRDIENRAKTLQMHLARVKELYEWGDISKQEYQAKKDDIGKQLRFLSVSGEPEYISDIAEFLRNVAKVWKEANQELRNQLAKTLFEQI